MKLFNALPFIVLLSVQSTGVIAQKSGELARQYCKSHSCEGINVIQDAIRTPIQGTCILVSSKTLAVDFKTDYSATDWWLLISGTLSGREFDQAIEVAKKFSGKTGRQTFLAQPTKGTINEAKADYCTLPFNLTKQNSTIGMLIPKL